MMMPHQIHGVRAGTWTALALACSLFTAACGDDDSGDKTPVGEPDSSVEGTSDSSVQNDQDGGVPDSSGPTVNTTKWVASTYAVDTSGNYLASLVVLDDLSANGKVPKGQDFGTDIFYTTSGDGVFFVGRKNQPNIQRWKVKEDGSLEKTGELGLDAYGITSTLARSLRDAVQFIDESRAYYIDIDKFNIIPFNPSTTPMTIYADEVFDFKGLVHPDLTSQVSTMLRVGDRLMIVGRFWNKTDGGSASPLVRVAWVDLKTRQVTYVDDTRCAQVMSTATDLEGNIYFGSHPALAVGNKSGFNQGKSPAACLLRMKKGESTFDPDYYVNLEEVSGGVAGGLLQGAKGYAFVMKHGEEAPITVNAPRDVSIIAGSTQWYLHSFKLGDEKNTFAKVEGLPKSPGYVGAFTTTVGANEVPFISLAGDQLGSGMYYDVSEPLAPKKALAFPSTPGAAIPLNK
jgi:hypothetical protein